MHRAFAVTCPAHSVGCPPAQPARVQVASVPGKLRRQWKLHPGQGGHPLPRRQFSKKAETGPCPRILVGDTSCYANRRVFRGRGGIIWLRDVGSSQAGWSGFEDLSSKNAVIAISLTMSCVAGPAGHAAIYRWVDKNGNVVYQDRLPQLAPSGSSSGTWTCSGRHQQPRPACRFGRGAP